MKRRTHRAAPRRNRTSTSSKVVGTSALWTHRRTPPNRFDGGDQDEWWEMRIGHAALAGLHVPGEAQAAFVPRIDAQHFKGQTFQYVAKDHHGRHIGVFKTLGAAKASVAASVAQAKARAARYRSAHPVRRALHDAGVWKINRGNPAARSRGYSVSYFDGDTGDNDERVFASEAAAKNLAAKWRAAGKPGVSVSMFMAGAPGRSSRTAAERAHQKAQAQADIARRAETKRRMAIAKKELDHAMSWGMINQREYDEGMYDAMVGRFKTWAERFPHTQIRPNSRTKRRNPNPPRVTGTAKVVGKLGGRLTLQPTAVEGFKRADLLILRADGAYNLPDVSVGGHVQFGGNLQGGSSTLPVYDATYLAAIKQPKKRRTNSRKARSRR